jgi:hypothetical protein
MRSDPGRRIQATHLIQIEVRQRQGCLFDLNDWPVVVFITRNFKIETLQIQSRRHDNSKLEA